MGQLDLNGWNANANGLSGDGLVINSGALATLGVGNNNASGTFAGTITGSIALTKVGTGILTLTGTNTYSGGTTITTGVVRINADGSLGAGSGRVTLNGGCLMNNGSAPVLNVNRTISLGASGGYFDAGWNESITINGQITGAGTLNINLDSGPVVLANSGNNYTGDTIIGTDGPGTIPPARRPG